MLLNTLNTPNTNTKNRSIDDGRRQKADGSRQTKREGNPVAWPGPGPDWGPGWGLYPQPGRPKHRPNPGHIVYAAKVEVEKCKQETWYLTDDCRYLDTNINTTYAQCRSPSLSHSLFIYLHPCHSGCHTYTHRHTHPAATAGSVSGALLIFCWLSQPLGACRSVWIASHA